MKKLVFVISLLLGFVLAETPKSGWAYVISAIGVKNSLNNVVYTSGDTSAGPNANYVLSPQVIVWDDTLDYVGSLTPFTGCLNSQHYSNGKPSGFCFTGGLATTEQDGLMSKEDKTKLENLNSQFTILENELLPNELPVSVGYWPATGINVHNIDGTHYGISIGTVPENDVYFNITTNLELTPGKTYKILGLSDNKLRLEVRLAKESGVIAASSPIWETGFYKEGVTDTFVYTEPIWVYIVIPAGTQITSGSILVKPMITRNLKATYDDWVPYKEKVAKLENTLGLEYIGTGTNSGENARLPSFDFSDYEYGAYLVANTNANVGGRYAASAIVCYTPNGLSYPYIANPYNSENFFTSNGNILYGRSVSWYAELKVWKINI